MSIVGRQYMERGKPVEIVAQWGKGGGPRNVLIRRLDTDELVVRSFRGLRKIQFLDGSMAASMARPFVEGMLSQTVLDDQMFGELS